MKTYTITYKAAYDYTARASRGAHMVRLLPVATPEQEVNTASLDVHPRPDQSGAMADFFANPVRWFIIDSDHDDLTLTMKAQVRVHRHPNLLANPRTWQDVAQEVRTSASLAPDSPAHFLQPAVATVMDDALHSFATRFFTPQAKLVPAVEALNRAIYDELRYDPEATDVSTTASEAFSLGAGVCQDFAHIMIAVCRSVGIPARYISGYIRTLPPPGKPRLEGADAMHAWVSVWTGKEGGWVDYDPTNGLQVLDEHITVAVGRDYDDTAPVRGEVVGGGSQSHDVAVDVVEMM